MCIRCTIYAICDVSVTLFSPMILAVSRGTRIEGNILHLVDIPTHSAEYGTQNEQLFKKFLMQPEPLQLVMNQQNVKLTLVTVEVVSSYDYS